jgi:hypothetical protein
MSDQPKKPISAADILANKQQLLEEAVANALVSLRKGTGTAKAFEEAEAALDRFMSRQAEEAAPAASGSAGGEWFRNETEARNWLLATYGPDAVSVGKFNGDVKKGMIKRDGKRLSKFDVAQYALTLKASAVVSAASQSFVDSKQKKEEADARRAVAEANMKEREDLDRSREFDEKWQLRREAEEHETALLKLVQNTFRQRVYLDHTHLLNAAGGKASHSPEFIIALGNFIDSVFNQVVAADEYDVEFDQDELL